MTNILPPNSTTLETALTTALAQRFDDTPVMPRLLWDIDTVPAAYLPFLAWSFSVDHWNPNWSDRTKRDVIKAARFLKQTNGYHRAVPMALAAIGITANQIEWFDDPDNLAPDHFRIETSLNQNIQDGLNPFSDDQTIDDMRRQIDTSKRNSQHYTLTVAANMADTLTLSPTVITTVSKSAIAKTRTPVSRLETRLASTANPAGVKSFAAKTRPPALSSAISVASHIKNAFVLHVKATIQ